MWKDKYELLKQIAHKIGTPIYVYDENILLQRINLLQEAFKTLPYQLYFAMKANENPHLLQYMLQHNLGVDTVSVQEVNRALEVGFKPEQIVYTPSCPSEKELDFAFQKNIPVHLPALEYFDYVMEKYPSVAVGLRINPANSITGNQKLATAHADSKFGIPIKYLDNIKSYVDKGLQVNALHIHTGSDVKSWHDLARSADVIFDVAKHFPHLKYIDLGSGFKVKYKDDDPEIELDAYADYIQKKIDEFPYKIKVKFEPGKFLTSQAGVLLVNVNIVKQGYYKKFVGVDSGFHHLIRSMYYNAYHTIVNISNPNDTLEEYDVVGQLCEEDTFTYNRKISKIRKGDLLIIKNAGAYGFSMAMNYNLRPLPQQVWIDSHNNFFNI